MNFWQKLKERLNEPSTWAGLALATQGATGVFKLDGGAEVAQAVAQTGQAVAQSGGAWQIPAMTLAFGLLAMFKKEKGQTPK